MVAPAGNAGRNSQRCQPARPLQMTDGRPQSFFLRFSYRLLVISARALFTVGAADQ
jgi:hypothetical protein